MEFDLTDPECFAKQDPHLVFKRLRAEDPMHWTTGRIQRGFWSITRYDDALTGRDPTTFSSQRYSMALPSNPEAQQMLTPEMRGCGQMMIATDPPRHNAMRRQFNHGLLPRAVARLESSGRRIVALTATCCACQKTTPTELMVSLTGNQDGGHKYYSVCLACAGKGWRPPGFAGVYQRQ
jgi:cytochrome P450